MNSLPAHALSVRQPWAWAIIHAGKDIENREQVALRHLTWRGPFCVHASLGMTQDEYAYARDFMSDIGVQCPLPAELLRGGIIGTSNCDNRVSQSDSPWFMGRGGLTLSNTQPVDFIASTGALGFFRWQPSGGEADPPKPWMRAYAFKTAASLQRPSTLGSLL